MSTTVMGRLRTPERFSAKNFLREQGVLGNVENYFKGTNLAIAKRLYALQKRRPLGDPKIALKKLSEATKIGEDEIRERVKDYEFLPLVLEHIKDKSGEWIWLTPLCIAYLEEEGVVDPYHYVASP